MSGSDKLDNCKKEIRSMLIPYQKGCSLRQFNKDYFGLIGKKLPAKEFGFRTDIDFLHSIPDVVKIRPAVNGDYLLQGIADEKSKHIQQMVMRQKPAKSRGPPLRLVESTRYKSRYLLPPRFSESKKTEEWNPPKVFHYPSPKVTPKEPLLPPPKVVPKEPLLPPPKVVPKESLLPPPKEVQKDNCPPQPKSRPEQEVITLVRSFNNKLALDDLLVEYKRMYNKNLSLSMYGFSSIKDCIDSIPELGIFQKNKVSFVMYRTDSQNDSDIEDENPAKPLNYEILSDCSNRIPASEPPPGFHIGGIGNQKYGNVPVSLRNKFKEVAKRVPDCIWSSEFLSYFEEVTSESLDLHNLGYTCLNDLIDDVPDIFVRKPVAGSRKDYVIYPADELKSELSRNPIASLPLTGPVLVDHIVLNLRKILAAYPEGIKIAEILHIYSINCKDFLHVQDLGFANLETFLSSIKDRVPIKFDFINGEKSVHLLKLSDSPTDVFRGAYKKEVESYIPFEAAPPDFQFKPLTLPTDFDYTQFFPVYTSAVASPGHLYIQFQEEAKAEPYVKLQKALDKFYHGNQSDLFMMRYNHITEGRSCIAKWPVDNCWYRAQILSVSSIETVTVHYVDYGTKELIPKSLLRYARKEFIDIPIQALKCRLAYLKKPNNAVKWDLKARERILSICRDKPLMVRIEDKGSDGIYSIVLCDTSDKIDVFINDVLCEEKLAEYDIKDDPNINNSVAPEIVQMEYQPLMNNLQALQAQYFLKAFAAVAPVFAQDEHYLALLKQVSTYCQNIDPVQQNVGMPIMAPAGPPGFSAFTPNMNMMATSKGLFNTNLTGAAISEDSSIKKPKSGISSTVSKNFIQTPYERESLTLPKSVDVSAMRDIECDNEIFDEDDDEIFQQFCREVSSPKIRCVKKVLLSDRFKIHIIVVESKPYASSGDISQLIWNNKEADYLSRRLQEVDIPSIILSRDGNENLFQQLERFNVKGVQNTTGFKSSILLYPLDSVVKILNIFGHPSTSLRNSLIAEITNFNPNNNNWQDKSPETSESDDDTFSGVTDDDKIERLCLHDLLAMKESIHCKRKKMLSSSSDVSSEVHKLEQLNKKVVERIKKIREICRIYS